MRGGSWDRLKIYLSIRIYSPPSRKRLYGILYCIETLCIIKINIEVRSIIDNIPARVGKPVIFGVRIVNNIFDCLGWVLVLIRCI